MADPHEILAALVHAVIKHDDQATSEGFTAARELGLLRSVMASDITPLGWGVLRALGYEAKENHGE